MKVLINEKLVCEKVHCDCGSTEQNIQYSQDIREKWFFKTTCATCKKKLLEVKY